MSFLPPVVLEIRANAAQFFAETAKVAESVKAMASETQAATEGMADKVEASTTQMGRKVATVAEMMASKSSAEAEAMARQVIAETEIMDAGASKAAEDMARKISAAFEAMELKTTASMEAQAAKTTAAAELQAQKIAATEQMLADRLAESAAKRQVVEERAAAASAAAADRVAESALKRQAAEERAALASTKAAAEVEAANLKVTQAIARSASAEEIAAAQREVAAAKVAEAAAKAAAAEDIAANKVVESAARRELAEARVAAATEASADKTVAAGLRVQDTFLKSAATAVSSTGTITGALVSSTLKQAEAAQSASVNLMGIADGITKVAAVTGVVVAGIGLDMAAHFQRSTNLLVTAGGESKDQLENVRAGILDIAQGTGTSSEQLAEGMYVMEKAGYRGAAGLAALRASAEGAKAENVDLSTMTQAVSDVLLDYGYNMSTAEAATRSSVEVTNMMVAASGAAKTTMKDFASSMAAVIPVASTAGISFKEVGGAIATMTQHGQTAQQSSQNLANLIQSLVRPNNQASAAMQQFGIDSQDLAEHLGERGLSGTLAIVKKAIDDHTQGSVVMQGDMKQNKAAVQDLNIAMDKLPSGLHDMAKGLMEGTTSQKDFQKAAKDTGGTAGAVADQFLTLYKATTGLSDNMKSGRPAAETYNAALRDVLGNMTAMRAATMLMMNDSQDFKRSIELITKAQDEHGKHISTWTETQAQLSTQLDMAKQRSENLAIEIGTKLVPAANGALSGFQDLFNGFEQGNPVLVGIATLLGGAVAVSVGVYTANMVKAGIATLDTFITMGANGIGAVTLFVRGMMASEIAVGQFATKAELAGATVRSNLLPMLGKLAGAATVVTLGVEALRIAQDKFGQNNMAPSIEATTTAMEDLAKTGDSVDHLFTDWDNGPLVKAPSDVHNLTDAIGYLNDGWAQAGDATFGFVGHLFGVKDGMDQVKERLGSMGDSLGKLVSGGKMDEAANAFDKISESFSKQGKTAQDALDTMPGYKKSLDDLTASFHVQLAPAEMLDLAMGKIPEKMLKAMDSTQKYTNAAGKVQPITPELQKSLDDAGVSADGLATDLEKLLTGMEQAGLTTLSARDAQFKFADAVQAADQKAKELKEQLKGDLSSALDETGKDFNKTTTAGKTAEDQFAAVTRAGFAQADSMAKNGAQHDELQGKLTETYNKMITTARGFGMGKDEAEALTRSVLHVPPGVDINSWMDTSAREEANRLEGKANELDGKVIHIYTKNFVDSIVGNKGLSEAQNGGPGGYTGGAVSSIMGMYEGGVVPGTPPQNPRFDNIRALVNGKPLNVQSGEYIVNGKQTKANLPWLKAINSGLNMSDLFRDHTPELAYASSPSLQARQAAAPPTVNNNDNSRTTTNHVNITTTADARSLAAEFSRLTSNL